MTISFFVAVLGLSIFASILLVSVLDEKVADFLFYGFVLSAIVPSILLFLFKLF